MYYGKVKDYVSLVRVYCCLDQDDAALELCNETGDAAACYHLARQLEAKEDFDGAIQLYTRARVFSSAVRLCKVSQIADGDINHLLALIGTQ